jgi:microcystin-dependent protein
MKKKNLLIMTMLIVLSINNSYAQDQFIGEIRIFAGKFAPKGWAFCSGQLLPISQNTALFSLLGTTYGGNGITNFALPNLNGRVPIHPGQGPGLSLYDLGETGGSETVTLTTANLPAHNHTISASTISGTTSVPTNAVPANTLNTDKEYASSSNTTMMGTGSVGIAFPVITLQPYLTLNYIIAIQGIFPPRN